ncbi:MAG: molybdopterin-dependent oxidoreductase [Chloroflexi bacterium]|nr:molybdopterin-dependent oxidoreductase [Chloroflexota bacterium]
MDKPIARDEYGATTAGARQPGALAELITPTENHYHVTKNPVSDPVVRPESWRLVLDGELQRPVQLDYRTLRQLPAVEMAKTLECISNFTAECQLVPFGCELIGTAVWKGVPLKDLIELAGGFKPGVVSVSLFGEDEFVSAIPAEVALDPGTLLAYEMNGDVLPYEHGYPARILTPGRYGYKSPKWVRGIRPTTREVPDWYAQRNWSKDGIVKTMSRIDVPAPGAALAPGRQRIAGIAYAADRGISMVEFSADGGQTWQTATFLEPAPGKDAWIRWEGGFELPPGAMARLFARATDGTGRLQTREFVLPAPNGASGWNSIEVKSA